MKDKDDCMKFYILCGPPGSGKSTWAAAQGLPIISSDAIRKEFTGSESDMSQDSKVWREIEERIIYHIYEGIDCIFDATSRNRKARKNYVRMAKEFNGVYLIGVDFFSNLNIEECQRRNLLRERVVESHIIEKFAKEFVAPSIEEGFDEIIKI